LQAILKLPVEELEIASAVQADFNLKSTLWKDRKNWEQVRC
jgi:hypothetical protein